MQFKRRYPLVAKPVDNPFTFFMDAILSARVDIGIRSNQLCEDEDVNVYFAHLLNKYADQEYIRSISHNICLFEVDMVVKQDEKYDMRDRYNLYRHTAEFLLVRLGIFNGFNQNLPDYKKALSIDNDVYVGRARAYFAQASSYAYQLGRGKSAIGDVLRKVSENFTVYLNLLYQVRDHYLNFDERFSDGEWFHFVHKNIIQKAGVDSKAYVMLMDEFLSRLSAWKKAHGADDRDMVKILGAELKRLNPEFHYDPEILVVKNAA
ncbi:MAG: hypothetical protein V1913_09495 [Fibrobacterota bacterium]